LEVAYKRGSVCSGEIWVSRSTQGLVELISSNLRALSGLTSVGQEETYANNFAQIPSVSHKILFIVYCAFNAKLITSLA
jgi:hypothetical protein